MDLYHFLGITDVAAFERDIKSRYQNAFDAYYNEIPSACQPENVDELDTAAESLFGHLF